jgi:hypothetical protein
MVRHDGYRVVFYRNGHEIETLYWTGSFQETQTLARKIACKGGALFRIFKLSDGAEPHSEGPGITPGIIPAEDP